MAKDTTPNVGDAKKNADKLNSATDPAQVNTEIFEIDEEAMKALPPEEQVNVLRTKMGKIKEEYVATVKINQTLSSQFDALSANAKSENLPAQEEQAAIDRTVSKETFKVGGAKYGFTMPFFQYEGKKVGAAEILASPELQKTLVDGGFGIIKKI